MPRLICSRAQDGSDKLHSSQDCHDLADHVIRMNQVTPFINALAERAIGMIGSPWRSHIQCGNLRLTAERHIINETNGRSMDIRSDDR